MANFFILLFKTYHWFKAAKQGNSDILDRILTAGFKGIDARDEYSGRTALHYAILNGHLDTAKYLINKGAQNLSCYNLNFRGYPTHLAVTSGHQEILKYLCTNKENLNVRTEGFSKDEGGKTPLHLAAIGSTNHSSFIEVERRIKKRFLQESNEKTQRSFVDAARILISMGAEVDSKDNIGQTPLFDASRNDGNLEMIKLLIANGADVNARDNFNRTPIFWADGNGVVEYLVESRADITHRDIDGLSPLDFAYEKRALTFPFGLGLKKIKYLESLLS